MTRFTTIAIAAAVAALVTTAGVPDAAARIAAPIGIAGDPGYRPCTPAPCPPAPFVRPDPGLGGTPFDGWDCPLINRPRCCEAYSPP